MPETPIPATARPIISMGDDCATPHSSDPSSNKKTKERKTALVGKYVYSLPDMGCSVAAASV
jgi:hypothetical protein